MACVNCGYEQQESYPATPPYTPPKPEYDELYDHCITYVSEKPDIADLKPAIEGLKPIVLIDKKYIPFDKIKTEILELCIYEAIVDIVQHDYTGDRGYLRVGNNARMIYNCKDWNKNLLVEPEYHDLVVKSVYKQVKINLSIRTLYKLYRYQKKMK